MLINTLQSKKSYLFSILVNEQSGKGKKIDIVEEAKKKIIIFIIFMSLSLFLWGRVFFP